MGIKVVPKKPKKKKEPYKAAPYKPKKPKKKKEPYKAAPYKPKKPRSNNNAKVQYT